MLVMDAMSSKMIESSTKCSYRTKKTLVVNLIYIEIYIFLSKKKNIK